MTNEPKKTHLGWINQPPVAHQPQDPRHYPQPYSYEVSQQSYEHAVAAAAAASSPSASSPSAPSAPPTVVQPDAAQQAYAHYYHYQQQLQQQHYQQQYQQQQYPQQHYPQPQPPPYEANPQPYAQDYNAQWQAHHQAQHAHAHAQQQQQQQQQLAHYPSANAYNFFGNAAVAAQQANATEPAADKKKAKAPKQRPIAAADATSGRSPRVRFIRLTYLHLLFAILGFAGLLALFMGPLADLFKPFVTFATDGNWQWGVVLASFMAVSWVADYWASHATSRITQYLGLALYVVAEAIIFVPLLAIVEWKTKAILAQGGEPPNIIRDSAFITLGIFFALTLSVFISRKDFSFLRSGLVMASGAALSLIAMSLIFGFSLGLVFSFAMVLLAAGYILYQTSQVLAHYHPNQYVAAALALFSSVALMFWYVIRIVMKMRE